MDEIFMDIPTVRDFSNNFSKISEALVKLDSQLVSITESMREDSFEGKIGTAAFTNYEGQLQPHIQELKEKCDEMSTDLEESATAYENEDAGAATYF